MGIMTWLLAIALAAVQLGGSFGSASASTVSLGATTMIIDLEVEVLVSAEAVVAHLSVEDETLVIPLLERDGGTYGIRTEVPLKNHVVVFEALGENGALSQPVTLSGLGAELTASTGDGEEDGLTGGTTRWGWLGLALGAASLSLLAFWVLGGREERARSPQAESDQGDSTPGVEGD
jgi:hypothetical protein